MVRSPKKAPAARVVPAEVAQAAPGLEVREAEVQEEARALAAEADLAALAVRAVAALAFWAAGNSLPAVGKYRFTIPTPSRTMF